VRSYYKVAVVALFFAAPQVVVVQVLQLIARLAVAQKTFYVLLVCRVRKYHFVVKVLSKLNRVLAPRVQTLLSDSKKYVAVVGSDRDGVKSALSTVDFAH